MFCCEKCCKEFKTNWQLQRHLRNKRPCTKVPQETSFFPQETSLKCEYCCELFSRSDNLKRHECKERNCHIRNLEIQLKMDIEIDIHSKQCRFCKKEFSQKCNCTRHINTCKKKLEYLSYLENKMKRTKQTKYEEYNKYYKQ